MALKERKTDAPLLSCSLEEEAPLPSVKILEGQGLCRLVREQLAQKAKEEWAADRGGEDALTPLPPLYDSVNTRLDLLQAQEKDPECAHLIWQKRSELDANLLRKHLDKPRGGHPLKPVEAAEYRLAAEDELLEKQLVLASCLLWAPVIPDSPVPDGAGNISWRRWLFDHSHCTIMSPHR